MRSIKKIHKAISAPIGNLITYRALPTPSIDIDGLDPFLFLNHHGPQKYPARNSGLPFGPHPHRGFETVTFILEGDIMHQDTGGHQSTIKAGGIQWMTAGRGLVHAEVSSEAFKANGGDMEILQLWVNLPARYKMTEPNYIGLQKEDIPEVTLDEGKVTLNVISGRWQDVQAPISSLTDIKLSTVYFKAGGKFNAQIPAEHTIFLYVVRGEISVNNQSVTKLNLVEFNPDGEDLHLEATTDSVILFGHAQPYNEPVVAYGPFVMNSEKEIQEAYQDYQQGKFGVWQD
ncbi:quercetin 2,3-dioxygenase [Adhaeribacter aerolatus]|uniref:Quercetin 2,3-dioxygenase n=1 Tax=Adhaeribacter aerolatus TaxID=670289 RepID=A0A512B5E7_9BACT|nr:pirin family protein [Adhaeribacter aerolatus]GEO07195.1 quercetin 2,3-dioxygenase [Adhaeribacter aerolatus]